MYTVTTVVCPNFEVDSFLFFLTLFSLCLDASVRVFVRKVDKYPSPCLTISRHAAARRYLGIVMIELGALPHMCTFANLPPLAFSALNNVCSNVPEAPHVKARTALGVVENRSRRYKSAKPPYSCRGRIEPSSH